MEIKHNSPHLYYSNTVSSYDISLFYLSLNDITPIHVTCLVVDVYSNSPCQPWCNGARGTIIDVDWQDVRRIRNQDTWLFTCCCCWWKQHEKSIEKICVVTVWYHQETTSKNLFFFFKKKKASNVLNNNFDGIIIFTTLEDNFFSKGVFFNNITWNITIV